MTSEAACPFITPPWNRIRYGTVRFGSKFILGRLRAHGCERRLRFGSGLKSVLGRQTRPSRAIGDMSPIPPITAMMLQRHERQKRANNGRERVQQWMHQKAGYWITSSARASLAAAPAIIS
jgi:hypothetical protein